MKKYEKSMDFIVEKLRDASNEAENMMWLELRQIESRVYESKNEQIKDLLELANMIKLYASSREALVRTHA